MNEETFKKILYLILKVIIKNNGFLSQLEIFRDVRDYMNNYFKIKENDLIVRIGPGKSEDFKDILNFVLTILCELSLVTQKMENKSFYFKWIGFKGFKRKYLNDLMNQDIKYDVSESFEHRIQVYTRNLILNLIEKKDIGVNSDKNDEILKRCFLENQMPHIEKIQSILKFIDFMYKETPPTNQIFLLNNQINNTFKINKDIIQDNIIKDQFFAGEFYNKFNEIILGKYKLWIEELSNNKDFMIENELVMKVNNMNDDFLYNPVIQVEKKKFDFNEINELEQIKVPISVFKSDSEECGFALLRGNNWNYYMKKLYCIIGRAPPLKNYQNVMGFTPLTIGHVQNITDEKAKDGNTYWNVDLDLGQNKRISKQHALIIFNFQTCAFEIKNLSKKLPIKVNGEVLKYNEEIPLSSKSFIIIGNHEFYFMLPIL